MVDSQGKSRELTRLRDITTSRLGFKVVVDLDPQTARASGPEALIVSCLTTIWVF